MSAQRVLISGASVAGPTAAYWFARAGWHVTVVERFPALRTNGHAIDIRTAGVTVMRKMPGMEAAVRARFIGIEGLRLVDTNGRPIATMEATGDPNAQSLLSEYEIFRGDLAKILYDLTAQHRNVTYVFDEQVASISQPADGADGPVSVSFTNGRLPTAEYDLVVAADGATSRTRALGLGGAVYDHVERMNTWSAYFSHPRDFLDGGKVGTAYCAAPGRFTAAGPQIFTKRNVINFTRVQPRDAVDRTADFRAAVQAGEAALKEYVAAEFAGIGWRADEMVACLREADDLYAGDWVQVKLPQHYKGRFALIGDAGMAPGPTGNGTSLAMASAYVLAGEMCAAKGDVRAGLAAFEARMRPIVADMQKIPPGVPAIMAPQTEWGLWARNTFLWGASVVARVGSRVGAQFAWLGGYWASSFGGDKYNLPEYDWVEPAAEAASK
ncbi:hypothetical protein MMC34_008244 [Xylographa carneopallida]|nr:hypothetical protein [Xylographa carneopallida]